MLLVIVISCQFIRWSQWSHRSSLGVILDEEETAIDRFDPVPEAGGQVAADKWQPVAKFEAFDNNNGEDNDSSAPGHEREYLMPERVEPSVTTSPGSVRYYILQRILQSNCYNSIHIGYNNVHKLRV